MHYECARTVRPTGGAIDMRILSLSAAPSKIPLERPALGIAEGSVDPQLGRAMPLFRRALPLAPAIVFSLLLAPAVQAQIPSASNTTSTPVPGAGHDYIHGPVETVNPANGSISIRIPVIVPPGRGSTLPFSFAYDSNGVAYIGKNTSGQFGWQVTDSWITKGGWSNTAPVLSLTEADYTVTGYNTDQTCGYLSNYVFQDPKGNRHNLGLVIEGKTGVNNGGDCVTNGPYSPTTSGGEGPILATTIQPAGTLVLEPVTVTDGDGTVFSFPQRPGGGGGYSRTLLPTSIVDRNGNILTVTPGTGFSYSIIDTLGRTLVNDSGIGVSPETVTISGLTNSYTLTWISLPAPSFTSTLTCLSTTGCPPAAPLQFTGRTAISGLTLPNGRAFTFSYDTTYDMINKITYPTGGYVRYVWGMNPQSEVGNFPCATVSGCTTRYDTPAITDRYVSFDGTTEVLHQHFDYSTIWPSPSSSTWTSKQTTITTFDLLRTTSFQTVYKYSSVPSPGNPDNGGAQLAVENSIAFYDTNATFLKTVTKTWQNVRLLKSAETTFPNGQAFETTYNYDANEMEIEHDDYDFGAGLPPNPPGPLLRATVTSYATFGTNHIVDKPSSVIVYSDAAKINRVAETDYTYDTPVGSLTSGIVQHSGGCNCGNLTKISRWLNTTSTTLATTFTNDDTGQRLSMTDPSGNQTAYLYADNYSSGIPLGPTNAYVTTITYPNTGVAHTEKFAYAYASGEVTSSTDQNNQVTSYQYLDNLARSTASIPSAFHTENPHPQTPRVGHPRHTTPQ